MFKTCYTSSTNNGLSSSDSHISTVCKVNNVNPKHIVFESIACWTPIRSVPQTNSSSHIGHLLPAETHSFFSQSLFVCSSTRTLSQSLVWLVFQSMIESKFSFACRRSRHQLRISQSINGFLLVHVRAWLTAFIFKVYISVVDPLNNASNECYLNEKVSTYCICRVCIWLPEDWRKCMCWIHDLHSERH